MSLVSNQVQRLQFSSSWAWRYLAEVRASPALVDPWPFASLGGYPDVQRNWALARGRPSEELRSSQDQSQGGHSPSHFPEEEEKQRVEKATEELGGTPPGVLGCAGLPPMDSYARPPQSLCNRREGRERPCGAGEAGRGRLSGSHDPGLPFSAPLGCVGEATGLRERANALISGSAPGL